jgi:hypothetical protein
MAHCSLSPISEISFLLISSGPPKALKLQKTHHFLCITLFKARSQDVGRIYLIKHKAPRFLSVQFSFNQLKTLQENQDLYNTECKAQI